MSSTSSNTSIDATNVTNIVSTRDLKILSKLNHKTICEVEDSLRSVNATLETVPLIRWMPQSTQHYIDLKFQAANPPIPDSEDWKLKDYYGWLFPHLKILFPEDNLRGVTVMDQLDAVKKLFFKLDIRDEQTVITVITKLNEISTSPDFKNVTVEKEKEVVKKVLDLMSDGEGKNPTLRRLRDQIKATAPQKLLVLQSTLLRYFQEGRKAVQDAEYFKAYTTNTNNENNTSPTRAKKRHFEKGGNTLNKKKRVVLVDNPTEKSSASDYQPCSGCGRTHVGTCRYANHPDFNRDSKVSWIESVPGKQWAERGEQVLPVQQTLSGKPWDFPKAPNKKSTDKGEQKGRYHNNKGNVLPCEELCVLTKLFESIPNNNDTNSNVCIVQGPRRLKSDILFAQAFLDTGALQNDYISEEFAMRLSKIGFNKTLNNNEELNQLICTPFGNCESSRGTITIPLRLLARTNDCSTCYKTLINNTINENNISEVMTSLEGMTMVINAMIINMPRFDLILGRKTIVASNLLDSWRQYLSPGLSNCKCAKTGGEGVASHGLDSSRDQKVSQPTESILAALYTNQLSESKYKRESMKAYLSYDGEEVDEIEFPSENAFTFEDMHTSVHLPSSSGPLHDEYLLVNIFGSESLQQNLRKLCHEYSDIFSSKLHVETADLPPFKLSCDVPKWESLTSNKLAPRVQSAKKQAETVRQIQELLSKKVISPCNVSSYSQILLVPKPDNKWRFCVDYRDLNACCSKGGWPIPNIKPMCQRIGYIRPRPKIFGKVDFTSGYHQIATDESTRYLLAFITFLGIFCWNRLPMGPKGAPSHFQQLMTSVVLAGLIYVICECYLDDIFIYGSTEEIFLTNVEQIFARFRKHKLLVNPKKCYFGMPSVDFVGHHITADGITFSPQRIQGVLDIIQPTYEKELKKFLGVINYFRDHIPNHSTIVHPLMQLVNSYTPTRKITWNPQALKAFEQINLSDTLLFRRHSVHISSHRCIRLRYWCLSVPAS